MGGEAGSGSGPGSSTGAGSSTGTGSGMGASSDAGAGSGSGEDGGESGDECAVDSKGSELVRTTADEAMGTAGEERGRRWRRW